MSVCICSGLKFVEIAAASDAVLLAPLLIKNEMDISVTEINLVEPITCSRLVPSDGSGALIGIIDSGFDLTHPSFLDAWGKTRILAAWDQVNLSGSAGAPPLAFDYGVEYTSAQIDEHVAAQTTLKDLLSA